MFELDVGQGGRPAAAASRAAAACSPAMIRSRISWRSILRELP
jgi:hypothetical protein